MTRRTLLAAGTAGWAASTPGPEVVLPVHLVTDTRTEWHQGQVKRFLSSVWAEAVRDLGASGIRVEESRTEGQVSRPSGREPVIGPLDRGAINMVLTGRIPLQWDAGRALGGVAGRYRGHDLCIIALDRAHGHQIPFFSVNTSLHEILHVLMGDTAGIRPPGVSGQVREARIDCYATRMWLLRGASEVRESARAWVRRQNAGEPRVPSTARAAGSPALTRRGLCANLTG